MAALPIPQSTTEVRERLNVMECGEATVPKLYFGSLELQLASMRSFLFFLSLGPLQ